MGKGDDEEGDMMGKGDAGERKMMGKGEDGEGNMMGKADDGEGKRDMERELGIKGQRKATLEVGSVPSVLCHRKVW